MPTPFPRLLPLQHDLAYAQMWEAYRGQSDPWRRVTESHRDTLVDYAVRRCPYYQRTIPAGASFEDIPLLTKGKLRDHVHDLLASDVPTWRRLPVQTSGSTGEPVTVYRDVNQAMIESASSDRFFRSLHGVPFDATIIAVTSTSRSAERLPRMGGWWARLRSALGGQAAHDPWLLTFPTLDSQTPRALQEHLDLWGRLRSYFFIGQASGIDWMAEQIEAGRVQLRREPVAVAASNDMLTARAKERIERVFGAWVHTRYGSVEFPFLAASLPNTTDRYVINPLLGYVELLDDEGRPVGPGELGRVVVTDLNNRVMPLIRYDMGDLAVASEEGFVGGFRLIEGLVGRESELLRFPSGRHLTASNLDKLLFKRHDFAPWVRAFQCAQIGANELELRIVWDREPGEVGVRIANAVRDVADPDTSVKLRSVDQLERYPSGKVWMVRALRAPEDAVPRPA